MGNKLDVFTISLNLILPVFDVACGLTVAFRTPMPETTVDEYSQLMRSKNKIRLAR